MAKKHPLKKKKRKKKMSGKRNQDKENQKREEANSSGSKVSTKFVTEEGIDDQPDFTSILPTEILQHIISFLPLESAAQTMLISSHWRQAWNVVTEKTGRIEDLLPLTVSFVSSVNWGLNLLTHPWKLRFRTEDGRMEMMATRGVNDYERKNKLRLDFCGGDKTNLPRYYDLELKIRHRCLSAHYSEVQSLCLVGVDHLSGEIVSSQIWEHLHTVERLEIRECHSLTSLIINAYRTCSLRHISIIDCDHLESVTIHLRYVLHSFRYRAQSVPRDLYIHGGDRIRLGYYIIDDLMFDFRKGTAGYNDNGNVWRYMCQNYVEHVTISQWTFQVMIKPNLQNNSYVEFINLKELWWTSADSMGEGQIDDLISFLLVCPDIEKLFVMVDHSPASDSLPAMKRVTENCSKQWRNRKTRLRMLKLVKMEGFPDEDMMMLADRIREIATNDPVIMATSRHLHPRSLVKIQPKRWRFVEEIDIELINTKHMHMSV